MDREPCAQHWLIEAAATLRRVTNAKSRFSAAMNVNKVSMLAGADELEAATRDAMVWVMENPCPDVGLDSRVALMLNTSADVALTARRALVHPSGDIEKVFARLAHLLAIIDFHSQTLGAW